MAPPASRKKPQRRRGVGAGRASERGGLAGVCMARQSESLWGVEMLRSVCRPGGVDVKFDFIAS